MSFVALESIFEALKTIFEVGFGRKVAGDGDPRLGHGQTQPWVTAERRGR
jgi:hypothetical protein